MALLLKVAVLLSCILFAQSFEQHYHQDEDYTFYTGYITANQTTNSTLFYQLIPAINKTLNDSNPIILWLQGGPGCSSQYGSWMEFGPYYVANISNELVPTPRNVSWSQLYHLLMIDSPSNVGFSIPGSVNVTDTETSQIEVYNVLVRFFEIYPELLNNAFYVFGESYGGHYVPYLAYEILTRGAKFNFSGIGIGNAWTDPLVQIAAFSDYSFAASVIDSQFRDQLAGLEILGQKLITQGKDVEANDIFNQIEANLTMMNKTGGLFLNNYRSLQNSDPTNEVYALTQSFLNSTQAKSNYNVSANMDFILCNGDVNAAWAYDQSTSVTKQLEYVLTQTRVLFYNGADDIECNTGGVLNFLVKLNWDGIKDFHKAERQIWKSKQGVLGNAKTSSNLTFVTVYKAGHYVPYYQPTSAIDMVQRFIDNNNNWSQVYDY